MLPQLLRIAKLTLVIVLLVLVATVGLFVAYRYQERGAEVAHVPLPPTTKVTTIAEVIPNWHPPRIDQDLPSDKAGEPIRYGYELVTKTYEHLGPELENAQLVFTGNNLACKNCHLQSGTQAGAASFVGVYQRFPQFRGREGKIGTLEDRINGCMERSMNGRRLADDSPEMQAMVAYMQWLSADVPEDRRDDYQGFANIALPDRAADTAKGQTLYRQRCAVCHGANGQGQRTGRVGDRQGYLYPPLWETDSYNHGAGMNRLIKAAQFIKGNMPLGATDSRPMLTDEEAYDIAAFVNSHDRPRKENTQDDYPNLTLKPVDAPYGPYADTFPSEQHRVGPFSPIIDYYRNVTTSREP